MVEDIDKQEQQRADNNAIEENEFMKELP